MTQIRAHHPRPDRRRTGSIDVVSVVLLLVALIAIALVLIGVARGHASPLLVAPPLLFAIWNVLTIRHRR
jgi:hypothetical protein